MKTNKILTALSFIAVLGMTACGSSGDSANTSDTQNSAENPIGDTTPEENQETGTSVVPNVNVTFGELVDSRDGQVYKTVQIGEQTWMAQNLNYAEVGVCLENNQTYCDLYGHLYTWINAVNNNCKEDESCGLSMVRVQGICPVGWHIPTMSEWNLLFNVVGDTSIAGKMLKSSSGWNDVFVWDESGKKTVNGNGIDAYGFSVLPAGGEFLGTETTGLGEKAKFWTGDERGANYYRTAYSIEFKSSSEVASVNFEFGYNYKTEGLSVRCVKD